MNLQDADIVIDVFNRAADAMLAMPFRAGSVVHLPAEGRLLATGDLHDNPLHLAKILYLARIEEPGHSVVLHEMIHSERLVNGVDLSYRMLARVAAAVVEHPERVHPVLANHELAQLIGRGVSKGAGNSVALFDDGLAFVFGNAWEEVADASRAFIRAMPLALRSESGLFCAHSLPAPRLIDRFDDGVLARPLEDDDYAANTGAAYQLVWGRGHGADDVAELAQRWGVELFCVGHEHVDTGAEARRDRLLVLNSDHDRGAVVPIDLAHLPSAEEAQMSAIPLRAIAAPEPTG